MKTTITKKELETIHNLACKDWKTKLINYATREPFSENVTLTESEIKEGLNACNEEQLKIVKKIFDIKDISSTIDSVESACKYLGESDDTVKQLRLLQSIKDLSRYILAEAELVVITRALNEKEELDWDNHNQYKYYLWWYLGKEFRLGCCSYDCADSVCSARLCFKNRQIALYASEQFKNIYEDYMNK